VSNVFRVNFSHADYADVKEKMKIIRDLNDEYGYTTAILGTYKDQNFCVGVMNEGVIVHDGDLITFTTAEDFLEQLKSVHEI
jgi:pyruvate kinase